MRNPYMKFQNSSIHVFKVMLCIKKHDKRTDGWTNNPEAICPFNFFEVGGIINASLQKLLIRNNSNTPTKTKSARAITQPKFCGQLQISKLTCILQCYISFCKFSIKSMHLCKVIDWKPISTHQQKLSLKRAMHVLDKIWQLIPISNLTCILHWYKVLQSLNEINASLQKLLSRNEQQKLSWKRAITQPKFGGWLPILNLTCILQW